MISRKYWWCINWSIRKQDLFFPDKIWVSTRIPILLSSLVYFCIIAIIEILIFDRQDADDKITICMGTIIKEKGWYALKHTPRVISDRIFGMQIYTWLIMGAGGGRNVENRFWLFDRYSDLYTYLVRVRLLQYSKQERIDKEEKEIADFLLMPKNLMEHL